MKNKKPKIKVIWTPDELSFIRENYYKMTWSQLVQALRKKRPDVEIGSIRHQCVRMNLKKQIQIRWSKEDIQFLKDNYKKKGNIEIAEHLNKLKRTFRVIDGKKQYRKFTKKHIEKKLKLLRLFRTPEERLSIYHRNLSIGKGYAWTVNHNAYTLGIREVSKNGEVRKWVCNGRLRLCVKTTQGFVSYPRKIWEEHNGKIPAGYNITFKDGNPENCSIQNLECISDKELANRNVLKYPTELRKSVRLYNKLIKTINSYEQ